MTRDEFNALPDGSVVQLKSGEQFRVQDGRLWSVVWTPMIDNNLDGMSVVSTPALPTLEDADVVRDDDGGLWARGQEGWMEQDDLYTSLPESDDTLTTKYGPITILVPGPRA